MKRQLLALSAMLLVGTQLYGLTANEVLQPFNNVYSTIFGQGYLFDKSIAAIQNDSLNKWTQAISKAKEFVNQNSKDLIGSKDSTLTGAMELIESTNIKFINAIKLCRGLTNSSGLQQQKAVFNGIQSNMKALSEQVKAKNFTLPSRKEAQRIAVAVAIYIESAAAKAQKDIANPPAPKDLPPVFPGAQNGPPTDMPPMYYGN